MTSVVQVNPFEHKIGPIGTNKFHYVFGRVLECTGVNIH